jgi:hypothetical protein
VTVVGLLVKVFAQAGDCLFAFLALCDQVLNLGLISLDQKRDIILVKSGNFNLEEFELLCMLIVNLCELMFKMKIFLLSIGLDFVEELQTLLMEFH